MLRPTRAKNASKLAVVIVIGRQSTYRVSALAACLATTLLAGFTKKAW